MSPTLIRWLEVVGSTQDAAHDLAASGAPHGSAVAARVQTAGRGTRRRQWISSEGGLWLSVVCRPREIAAIEAVSLRVGLGLASLLERWLPQSARIAIKWPNDLYLDDRKAGGVLAEGRWQGDALGWLAVGVGINVRNALPLLEATPATRLADFGVSRPVEELAPLVAAAVSEATRSGSPLTPQEIRVFEARDWLRGREVTQPHRGVAAGVSEEGKLRIRISGSQVLETLGSVELAGQPG